jgi:hypothetical protein
MATSLRETRSRSRRGRARIAPRPLDGSRRADADRRARGAPFCGRAARRGELGDARESGAPTPSSKSAERSKTESARAQPSKARESEALIQSELLSPFEPDITTAESTCARARLEVRVGVSTDVLLELGDYVELLVVGSSGPGPAGRAEAGRTGRASLGFGVVSGPSRAPTRQLMPAALYGAERITQKRVTTAHPAAQDAISAMAFVLHLRSKLPVWCDSHNRARETAIAAGCPCVRRCS